MAIPSNISMPNIPPGLGVPPGVQAPGLKSSPVMSIDEALNILSLINVGKEVLDVSKLSKEPPALIKIATAVVSARKSGAPVEFANGRIHVPEELFNSIVASSKSKTMDSRQIGGLPQEAQQGKAPAQKQAPQFMPMFAPPPPVIEEQKRRERLNSPKVPGAVPVSEDSEDEDALELSQSQAYHILIDIVPPGGGKYVLHVSEKFGGSEEEKKELESGLDGFWKDFGRDPSVNAKLTSFTIKPMMLLGDGVNPVVSKRLVMVYIAQSTKEKLSDERLSVCPENFTINPTTGAQPIVLFNREIIEYLVDLQMSSGPGKSIEGIVESHTSGGKPPDRLPNSFN